MTYAEIIASDKAFLTPADIAPVLACDPHSIRLQAEVDASALGFPVTRVGRRTKIPRLAFIRFMEGLSNEQQD